MARSDKRAKLLQACLDLLNELPARELTLELVAERSGINRGLIFYYFVSREGLLRAATERFRDSFLTSFDPASHENTKEWLTSEITRLLDHVDRNTGLMEAATFELGSVPGVTEALQDINEFNSDRIASALGLASQSDLFRAVIGSWGVYCARHVTRAHLLELITVNLLSSLELIRREEPELGIPAHPFS